MRALVVVVALALLPLGTARAQFCPGADPYVFTDVPANDAFCGFITRMAVEGITTGCSIIDANNRLFCPDNFVTRKQMSAFMIRLADAQFPLNCAIGSVMKWNGTDWVCAADDGSGGGGTGTVTNLVHGNGIILTPNPITTLGTIAADTNFLQRRVSFFCAAGSSIREINADGSVVCEPDDVGGGTVTSVGTGQGLTGGPITTSGTINVDTNYLQRRVASTCAAGSSIRTINVDGTVACEVDDVGGGGSLPGGQAGQTLRHDGTSWVASGALLNLESQILVGGVLRLPSVPRINVHDPNGFLFDFRFIHMTGVENTFVGIESGSVGTPGPWNTAIGYRSLSNLASGGGNTAIGTVAGYQMTTGSENSFFGTSAGYGTVSGSRNSFFGNGAGSANTVSDNSFFGTDAGLSNTTGAPNAFFGVFAGQENTTGGFNAFFGARAGLTNTTGGNNSFFGADAGRMNTTAGSGAFFGYGAGQANTTGGSNSFFGAYAGNSNTTGTGNAFFGWRAGRLNTTGNSNAFFGFGAGSQNATGGANAFVGTNAGVANVAGSANTILGHEAGFSNNGDNNVFVGYSAGRLNSSGDENTAVGTGAGSSTTTGNQNVFVGALAGLSNTTGSNNTYLGSGAGGTPGLSRATAIGAGALVQQSNSIVLGAGTDNVGIGTTNPATRLHVVGDVTVQGNVSKAGGSFRIDHPQEPGEKYLSHSFVESPDMKNIYDGVAVLDAAGEATIVLPEWFGALNRDFRYQLTCIGGHAPVYVAQEVTDNRFRIAGGRAGLKVSWQVTGIRQDAWANANRVPVEEHKPAYARGYYLHPEAFGMPRERGIDYARKDGPVPAPALASVATH